MQIFFIFFFKIFFGISERNIYLCDIKNKGSMILSKIFNLSGVADLVDDKASDSKAFYQKLYWFNRGSLDQLNVDDLKAIKKVLNIEHKKTVINIDKLIKSKGARKTA